MFEEFEHVQLKGKDVTGNIIDIFQGKDGKTYYTFESDTEDPIDHPDAWNDVRFPQLICTEDQLEHI